MPNVLYEIIVGIKGNNQWKISQAAAGTVKSQRVAMIDIRAQ